MKGDTHSKTKWGLVPLPQILETGSGMRAARWKWDGNWSEGRKLVSGGCSFMWEKDRHTQYECS